MKRAIPIVAALALSFAGIAGLTAQSAFAAGSDGACWGAATANFVPLGEHSSDPDGDGTHGDGFENDQHREGLGNLKNLFTNAWIGLLGFLGLTC